MGNSKNKRYSRNGHRRIMQRRWHAEKYRRMSEKRKAAQSQKAVPTSCELQGCRIVNLDKLQEFIHHLTAHAAACGPGCEIILQGETRAGLASILSSRCSKCQFIIPFATSDKVTGPKGVFRWEVNLGAVWGQMSTGGGYARLKETMSTLGVQVMSPKSFIDTERSIGQWWQQQLQEVMADAGREEKRLAEERGDFHEGVPAITVIVDGGWSKRSHRHSYNAKSGVGIIIGQATGKLLHIGVRNKYCTACTQGHSPDQHSCFKNWDKSSSEMEADIILEGFKEAEQAHGVRYLRFIGDGDSSVHPTLIQCVPRWGRHITKIECANHCCKCYRSALEQLVQLKPQYKGKGGLTDKMRRRLTSAARCAIKMRSQEPDVAKAVKQLKLDLQNGPFHCFGIHGKCSADFCRTAREQVQAIGDGAESGVRAESGGSGVRAESGGSGVRAESGGSGVRAESGGSGVRAESGGSGVRAESGGSGVRAESGGSGVRAESGGSGVRAESGGSGVRAESGGSGVRAESGGSGVRAESGGSGVRAESGGSGVRAESGGSGVRAESGGSGVRAESGGSGVRAESGGSGVRAESGGSGVRAESGGSGVRAESGGSGIRAESGGSGVRAESGGSGVRAESGDGAEYGDGALLSLDCLRGQ